MTSFLVIKQNFDHLLMGLDHRRINFNPSFCLILSRGLHFSSVVLRLLPCPFSVGLRLAQKFNIVLIEMVLSSSPPPGPFLVFLAFLLPPPPDPSITRSTFDNICRMDRDILPEQIVESLEPGPPNCARTGRIHPVLRSFVALAEVAELSLRNESRSFRVSHLPHFCSNL